MELINKMKGYVGMIKQKGLQSVISENKEAKDNSNRDSQDIVNLVKENPYSIDLLVISFMIRTMTQYKEEEQGKYNEVLGLINELQAKKESISNTDRIRLNTANAIMYEVSSNISRLEEKIRKYNNEINNLQDLVKENIQLHKPKYNLIFKKK
jgi:hypothetical protein